MDRRRVEKFRYLSHSFWQRLYVQSDLKQVKFTTGFNKTVYQCVSYPTPEVVSHSFPGAPLSVESEGSVESVVIFVLVVLPSGRFLDIYNMYWVPLFPSAIHC